QNDCPLPPTALVALVARNRAYQLTPDLRLTRRFNPEDAGDAVDRVRIVLNELRNLQQAA
ncbi:MAG TPA: hypothetical protein VHZ95_10020, partial [Polyangiales bacterium]|nr:hypothetical protein [Polyangiales bacterium]